MLADVVDKQSADRATVVCRGDGTVSLLAGGIPDLGLDGLGVNLDGAGSEFDADGRLGAPLRGLAGDETRKTKVGGK